MIDMLLLEYQNKINARLDMLIPQNGMQYDNVVKASRYSLLGNGKRIRPIILLEFYKLCGGSDDCAYNFACAVEMIHTYSLIHDDLPCMDNDDFRRGRPSCHKEFGETMALLAGDALLTESFGVASKTMEINPEYVVKALALLSANSGINGMVGGQVMDIEGENREFESEFSLQMCKLKTGALIKTAAMCGAILAGADDELVNKAGEYGENLGLAFQLVDDILDASGDQAVLGKSVGSDEKNDKKTFVSALGIDYCKQMADEYTKKALDALEFFDGDKKNIIELTNYLLKRKN